MHWFTYVVKAIYKGIHYYYKKKELVVFYVSDSQGGAPSKWCKQSISVGLIFFHRIKP